MPNRLAEAMGILTERLTENASDEWSYDDGAGDPIVVNAIIGRVVVEVSEAVDIQFGATDCDFLVSVAELIRDSEQLTPKRGAKLTRTAGGQRETFEVGAIPGLDVWNYANNRTMYRIHAKRIKVEAV